MDFLQRLSPGQKLKGISSRFYNVLVDVVQDKISSDAFMSDGMSNTRQLIQIVNSTGSTLDQFAIVGIGEAAILPVDDEIQFRNEHAFYAAAPVSTSRFAIIQDTIPDGSIGNGLLFGISKVQISVSDSTHIYADPIDSDTAKMASGTHGQAAILWTDDIPAAAVGGTILTGSGAPSGGTGSDGNYYKDTLNSQYYGPKAAGAWGSAHDYGTGIVWAVVLFGSVSFGNIVSINGDTTAAQILNTGTTGTDFAIDDSTPGTHKFNLPTAGPTVTRGLDTNGLQDIGGRKHFMPGNSLFGGDGSAGFISDYGHITNNAFEISNLQTSEDPTVTVSGGAVSGQVMQLNGWVISSHGLQPGTVTADLHYYAGFEARFHEENFPAYNAGTTYSRGNMPVRYSGVTYMYINNTPSSGNTPPNGTYWAVVPADMTCRFYLDNNVSDYGSAGPDFHFGFVIENVDGDSTKYPMICLRKPNGVNVDEVSGKSTTDPFGAVFTSGILTTTGTGTLAVSKGGTGRTTLDSGQLLAGAGTSAVDSLSSTRVSGETIELKLGSDSWIAFSEGSF